MVKIVDERFQEAFLEEYELSESVYVSICTSEFDIDTYCDLVATIIDGKAFICYGNNVVYIFERGEFKIVK